MACVRHGMRRVVAVTVLVLVAMAACGQNSPAGDRTQGLDSSWELREGTGPDGPVPLVDGHPITLTVDTDMGTVSGRAACNSYGGDVTLAGDRITITELFATEMACMPEPVMASEQAYLATLPRADTVVIEGDRLELSGTGVELLFDRMPEPEDRPLVGTQWELDTLIDGEAATNVPGTERDVTLELRDDGGFQAFTGCNTIDGQYTDRGDRLDLVPLAITDVACPDLKWLQDHVVAVLTGEVHAEIRGNRLTLMAPDGLGLSYRASFRE
jgi:heat shock protein HslJ